MEENILFVDETLKTYYNPYFCMSGIAINRKHYEDTVINEINSLKIRHFSKSDVILHYSDMNNKKGDFSIFKDGMIRQKFWTDYVTTVKKLDFVSFGVYFNQDNMKTIFNNGTFGFYDIAFIALVENYLHYLKSKNSIGSICVESRLLDQNAKLQSSYYNYLKNGSMYFKQEDYEKHLSSLGFIIKNDNCIGLQIADIAPSSLMRIVNNSHDKFGIGNMYMEKLYCYKTPPQDILGLKKIM